MRSSLAKKKKRAPNGKLIVNVQCNCLKEVIKTEFDNIQINIPVKYFDTFVCNIKTMEEFRFLVNKCILLICFTCSLQ